MEAMLLSSTKPYGQGIVFNSLWTMYDFKCSRSQGLQVFSYHPSVIQTLSSPMFTEPHRVGRDGCKNHPRVHILLFALTLNKSPCTAAQGRYRNPFFFTSLYCSVTLQKKCAWGFGMYCPSGWVHSPANPKFKAAKCLECFVSEAWCIFRTELLVLHWAIHSWKRQGSIVILL